MEERVGIWWHQWLNRMAGPVNPQAAVSLTEMRTELAILFRALGGAHGLAIDAAAGMRHGARRSLLARMAGSQAKIALAGVDEQALRLPPQLNIYPTTELNRDLYRWLAALCAMAPESGPWLLRNQIATRRLLDGYAGLAASYQRLLAAELMRRPQPASLPADGAQLEAAIRQALSNPGSVLLLPASRQAPEPVLLWLSPQQMHLPQRAANDTSAVASANPATQEDKKRRLAEDAAAPARDSGLLIFRPESIFSWTEYAKVEHAQQDNEDEDLAQAADDLDSLSMAEDGHAVAKKLRMNLDRAARAEMPGHPAAELIRVPEWDYRSQTLKADHCAIQMVTLAEAPPCALPERLHAEQRRLQRQLSALAPERQLLRHQPDGDAIDIDGCIQQRTHLSTDLRDCYLDMRKRRRDISCLLLADLSLSTEASIDGGLQVIDVIRDSLLLFAESLTSTRDRMALYGFSSRQRHQVRFSAFKTFNEPYDDQVRGRICQIKPAFYTRMGAAIRHAGQLLAKERSRERLLLLLSDGKPNDNDYYEGRYGIEDTRQALQEARRMGLRPFCITIDQQAEDYLPHIFGQHSYIIIKKPADMPQRLALLYAQLTVNV